MSPRSSASRSPSSAQPPSLVVPAVVGRDEREPAERPGREDLGALPLVAIHRRLRLAAGLRPVPAEDEQTGQHRDVERVVTARTRLRADRLAGHRDRPIEIVHDAGDPERAALGALLLPGSAVGRDQGEAALDRARAGRPDERELADGAEQEGVREGVRIDRVPAAFQQAHRFVDEADAALEVPLHHEVGQPAEDDSPPVGDRRRPRRIPARRAASPRRSGRGSSEGSRGGSARPPGPDRRASARWHPRGSGRTRGTPAGR